MEWRTMESAPIDGSDILIVCKGSGCLEVSSYWESPPSYWKGHWGDGEYEHTPVYWQPLPDAPEGL